MRIKITESFCEGYSPATQRGEVFDCPDPQARRLISLGRAIAVDESTKPKMEAPTSRPAIEFRGRRK